MNPPANVVIGDVFKPSNKMCGAIFEVSGEILQKSVISTTIVIVLKFALGEPINM